MLSTMTSMHAVHTHTVAFSPSVLIKCSIFPYHQTLTRTPWLAQENFPRHIVTHCQHISSLLLAFLFIFCFVFKRLFTFGQVKSNTRDGRSRHRPTKQSFRVCKVNLAIPKVAKKNILCGVRHRENKEPPNAQNVIWRKPALAQIHPAANNLHSTLEDKWLRLCFWRRGTSLSRTFNGHRQARARPPLWNHHCESFTPNITKSSRRVPANTHQQSRSRVTTQGDTWCK